MLLCCYCCYRHRQSRPALLSSLVVSQSVICRQATIKIRKGSKTSYRLKTSLQIDLNKRKIIFNLFKCTICDLVDRNSTVVALHVETHHAVKRSIFLDSARAKLITNRNLIERDGMISVLGKNDDPSKSFWLPY